MRGRVGADEVGFPCTASIPGPCDPPGPQEPAEGGRSGQQLQPDGGSDRFSEIPQTQKTREPLNATFNVILKINILKC